MIPNYLPNQYGMSGGNYPSVIYPEKSDSSTLVKRLIQATVDFAATIICLLAFACVYFIMDPRISYYTCDMSDVSFPFIPDTINFIAVALYGTVPVVLIIILIEMGNARLFPFQNRKSNQNSSRLRQFIITSFHGLSLFAFGTSITLLLTAIGKRWIGKLRPHFLAVCKPVLTSITCTTNTATGFIYISSSTGGSFCTNNDAAALKEARLSFPSGHASLISYTMIFLILFLQARLYLLRFRYVKALLQLAAFITAYVTSVSRIIDYQQRGVDVLAGMILGCGVALFIIYYVGRVLWVFERDIPYSDFDFKPNKFDQQSGSGNNGGNNRNRIFGASAPSVNKVLPDRYNNKFPDLNNI